MVGARLPWMPPALPWEEDARRAWWQTWHSSRMAHGGCRRVRPRPSCVRAPRARSAALQALDPDARPPTRPRARSGLPAGAAPPGAGKRPHVPLHPGPTRLLLPFFVTPVVSHAARPVLLRGCRVFPTRPPGTLPPRCHCPTGPPTRPPLPPPARSRSEARSQAEPRQEEAPPLRQQSPRGSGREGRQAMVCGEAPGPPPESVGSAHDRPQATLVPGSTPPSAAPRQGLAAWVALYPLCPPASCTVCPSVRQ